MQPHQTGAKRDRVGKRHGGPGPRAFALHNFHTGADIPLRVLHRIQRNPAAVGRLDTKAPVAHALHQPQPGRHGPVHVVSAGPQRHPQQPAARRVPSAPDGQLQGTGPGSAPARRHRHHRWPSHYVGLQPLHRHSAATPLSGHRHAQHRHRVHILPVDATSVDFVRLLPHDTLSSVPIAAMSINRVN